MLMALDLDYYGSLWEPWRELERVIVVSRAIHGARALPLDLGPAPYGLAAAARWMPADPFWRDVPSKLD